MSREEDQEERKRSKRLRALYGLTAPTFLPKLTPSNTAQTCRVDGVVLSDPLRSGERGGVLPQPFSTSNQNEGFNLNGISEYDESCIRSSLLFFDKIDCPENNFFSAGDAGPSDLQLWEGLQKSRTMVSGRMDETVFEKAFVSAFEKLNSRDLDRWSIVRPNPEFKFPSTLLGEMHGFKLKLYGALPVPEKSVPYEDVLRFKERRGSELQSLRHHIEELALQAASSGLTDLHKEICFEKFTTSLSDYIKSSMQENTYKVLSDIEIHFNWNQAISGLFKSIPLAALLPGIGIISILHDIGSSISIESTKGLRKKAEKPTPFYYIGLARKEI